MVVSQNIELKSPAEIDIMAEAGGLLAEVRDRVGEKVRPGVTTLELDHMAQQMIEARGAKPAFLGYQGFKGTLCTSVNEEIVHGIPSARVLEEGDIVTLDVGLIYKGFCLDSAATFAVGEVDVETRWLLDVCQASLELGISEVTVGQRLGDYSAVVQKYVESAGFSVVREYAGHGIGRSLHEEPRVPNYGKAGRGLRWEVGMVIALEPMICAGAYKTRILGDRWTVVTADGKKSAHFEHTVAVCPDGPRILTEK